MTLASRDKAYEFVLQVQYSRQHEFYPCPRLQTFQYDAPSFNLLDTIICPGYKVILHSTERDRIKVRIIANDVLTSHTQKFSSHEFLFPGNFTGLASAAMAWREWKVEPIRSHSLVPIRGAAGPRGRWRMSPPDWLTMKRCRKPIIWIGREEERRRGAGCGM